MIGWEREKNRVNLRSLIREYPVSWDTSAFASCLLSVWCTISPFSRGMWAQELSGSAWHAKPFASCFTTENPVPLLQCSVGEARDNWRFSTNARDAVHFPWIYFIIMIMVFEGMWMIEEVSWKLGNLGSHALCPKYPVWPRQSYLIPSWPSLAAPAKNMIWSFMMSKWIRKSFVTPNTGFASVHLPETCGAFWNIEVSALFLIVA